MSKNRSVMKKWIVYTVLFLAMFLVLYLMNQTFYEVRKAVQVSHHVLLPIVKMQLLAFAFGILVEWRRLYKLMQGQIRRSWKVIPFLALSILVLTPSLLWIEWDASSLFFAEWLLKPEIGLLVTGFVGNGLLRSMVE